MHFTKSFTKQTPLSQDAIRAAIRVLQSADLHRYQSQSNGLNEVAELEQEFAAWQGTKYCLAVASGGQAIQLALRAVGVKNNDPVLTNAFTLAPVPGAIRAVGANPVLVEANSDLVIDLEDLERKLQNYNACVLVLSHMRGHLADMDKLADLASRYNLTVIEDCAHTMGATWRGRKSGNFGSVGCFSTQSYKHLNSGEGGFLTTDDPGLMATATICSGSYMNYQRHGTVPDEMYFEDAKYECPNMSARMDALRAAVLRPQLAELDCAILKWNHRHSLVHDALAACNPIKLPKQSNSAQRVGSSIQFRIPEFSEKQCSSLLQATAKQGVELKWFGRSSPMGYTSVHTHWRYLNPQSLPATEEILSTLFDMRIPLTFSDGDCLAVTRIITEAVVEVQKRESP